MIGYNNPKVILLPDPVGLDLEIQSIQVKLAAEFAWLDRVFGRAILQRETRSEGKGDKEVIYPEAYGKNQEPINIMMNDNLKSQCFFIARDPGTFLQYETFATQLHREQRVSIIFWLNLKKIDPTKGYRFTEVLKRDIIRFFTKIPNVVLVQTFENWDKVFENMTITSTFKQYLKPPYSAFRIDANITFNEFQENCQ